MTTKCQTPSKMEFDTNWLGQHTSAVHVNLSHLHVSVAVHAISRSLDLPLCHCRCNSLHAGQMLVIALIMASRRPPLCFCGRHGQSSTCHYRPYNFSGPKGKLTLTSSRILSPIMHQSLFTLTTLPIDPCRLERSIHPRVSTELYNKLFHRFGVSVDLVSK